MEKEKKLEQRRKIYKGAEKVGSVRVEESSLVPWRMRVRTRNRVYFLYKIKEDLWLVKERSRDIDRKLETEPSQVNSKFMVVCIDKDTIFVETVYLDERLYLTNEERVDMILRVAVNVEINP
jgi:hypothetical protein